jgi:hypothetical protein
MRSYPVAFSMTVCDCRYALGLFDTFGKDSKPDTPGVRPIEVYMCSVVKRMGYADGMYIPLIYIYSPCLNLNQLVNCKHYCTVLLHYIWATSGNVCTYVVFCTSAVSMQYGSCALLRWHC